MGAAVRRSASSATPRTRSPLWATGVALLLVGLTTGCQVKKPEVNRRLIQHQAMVDFSGLKSVETLEEVRVTAAAPRQWTAAPLHKTGMYAHQQWKSPTGRTGVGVAFIRLPLPLNEKAVLWFAKREYTKRSDDGQLLNEWVDDLGRHWFEAENDKYHVRGYAITRGWSAWIVYFGHKINYPPDPAEISLAARACDTIVPQLNPPPALSTPPEPQSVTAEAK